MIVVTTPTGRIGSRLVPRLLAEGRPVRVIARTPAALPADVRAQADVVEGSHRDPEVVGRAFAGAEAVFWVWPADRTAAGPEAAYVEPTRPAAEAIRRLGVPRVVSVSALGRGTPYAGRAGNVTGSLAMDDLLADTGAAFRALAMPTFMDNLARQAPLIREKGVFYDVLSPGHRGPAAAAQDMAAIAARLLTDPSWTGTEEVPVLGPEDLSQEDLAAIATDVLGTPVKYEQIPLAALKEQMRAGGASEAMAQSMVDMAIAKENGLDNGIRRTPHHATEAPTTFRTWCTNNLRPATPGS
ncbi:NAD(P)H-binding protein [Amycolatopsis ultiminotia]|uniref:NAD(P)H-binding protein n=1 Tax=Amycolatopsis ultiminotia TaxID=543629 RepID=A0ABP6UZN0_9PSEU